MINKTNLFCYFKPFSLLDMTGIIAKMVSVALLVYLVFISDSYHNYVIIIIK